MPTRNAYLALNVLFEALNGLFNTFIAYLKRIFIQLGTQNVEVEEGVVVKVRVKVRVKFRFKFKFRVRVRVTAQRRIICRGQGRGEAIIQQSFTGL